MTFSVNKVCLAGNVGGDPDVKRLQSGKRIANLMLATNEAWTHQGKPQERTDWHRIVFLSEGHIAAIEELVRNGSLIYIEGKLQARKYRDADGVEHTSIEVVVSHPYGSLHVVRPGNALPSRAQGSHPNEVLAA
jgi:single-strand DNA-binding protein